MKTQQMNFYRVLSLKKTCLWGSPNSDENTSACSGAIKDFSMKSLRLVEASSGQRRVGCDRVDVQADLYLGRLHVIWHKIFHHTAHVLFTHDMSNAMRKLVSERACPMKTDLQKPSDLDVHCFQRQCLSWFSRTMVKNTYKPHMDSERLCANALANSLLVTCIDQTPFPMVWLICYLSWIQ